MTTTLHHYGSAFVLTEDTEDAVHRTMVASYFDTAEANNATVHAWFDLRDGGHITIPISKHTPLAIQTS